MDCLNNEQALNSQLTSNSDSISNTLNSGDVVSSTLDTVDRITSTLSSNDNTTSQMGNEEPLNSVLDQPTIHKYVGGSTDNIIVEVDNVGRIITATLKPIRFKTVADFPVVGSDKLIYIDASNNSLYSWDSVTQTYSQLVAGGGGGESYDDTELRNMIAELNNKKADKTEIPDVSNFITRVVDDLENYYTKSQSYTRSEIDEKVSAIPKFSIEAVDTLPTSNISSTTVYLLKTSSTDTDNLYQEYIYINNTWELLGTQRVDLTNYVTTDALNTALSKYVLSTTFNYQMGLKVGKTGDEEIQGVKTFRSAPVLDHNRADNSFNANEFVPARYVDARIEEEKLVAGKNIVIEGNTISADLGDGASITKLTSPVTISTLAGGVYQLPANCELYMYSGAKINYYNTSPATLNVQVMTENNVEKRLFVLFAEAKGKTSKEIGTNGSFIVGKVGSASGNYHIVGTNNSYVLKNEDDTIYGNKTFDKATKYASGVSLATTLNDKTLVDANWVQALLTSKGYLTSVPSQFITETELENRLSNFTSGTQIIWEVWE